MLVKRTPLVLSILIGAGFGCANKDSGDDDGSANTLAPTDTGTPSDDGNADDPSDPSDPSDPTNASDATLPDDTTGGTGDDCCEAHTGPGCNDPDVEACVCEDDAVCCTFDWDAACVNAARLRCGACGGNPVTTDPTTDPTTADDGSTTEMTTVATDPTGMTTDPTGGGDACCQVTMTPGCPTDPQLEACVCQLDAFCCDEEWDSLCVGQAIDDCAAQCVFGTGCCEVHPVPGCDDAAVQACVCAVDAFCCDEQWDMFCVDQVVSEQCGAC